MKLSDITSGITSRPPRILIHSQHGVGKSFFSAQAPAPIFIQTEDGLVNIDVPHFPLSASFEDVLTAMTTLIIEDHEFKTVVVDTLDWLEKLIHLKVCQDNHVDNLESLGWGRGYGYAMSYWTSFFNGLDAMRNKNMAIILLCHDDVKTLNPPDSNPYEKYVLKIHKTAAAMAEEWADIVGYASVKVFVATDKMKKGKATGGERVLNLASHPAYSAKNRYGITEEIPFNFTALINAIKGDK